MDGHCWRIGRLRRECSKARDASGREWPAREPSGNTVEIEGRSRSDVLQARLGQAAVARPAQAEGPHALSERALHPLALRVEAPAVRRALPCPGRSEGFVFALRKKGEQVWSKPASASSRASRYFQSIRARTASAAWRSLSPSRNCMSVTSARRQGVYAGWPRGG